MSTAARLAKLEGTLSPKSATLAWLAEAHQFPTLPAYVAWLREQPVEAAPFWRVPEQAERAVRAALRGEPRGVIEAAAHQAIRDAVFLVELVIVVNALADDLLRVDGLRYATLAWQARALASATIIEPQVLTRPEIARFSVTTREAVDDWAIDLEANDAAQHLLERRYLDGHTILFTGAAASWHALRGQIGPLRALGDDAFPPAPRPRRRNLLGGRDRRPHEADAGHRATSIAERLVGQARSAAARLLGGTGADDAHGQRRASLNLQWSGGTPGKGRGAVSCTSATVAAD